MKLDTKKNYGKAKWFDKPEGGRFLIKPYPASRESLIMLSGGRLAVGGEQQLDKFMECLIGWEDVNDDEGKPIPIDLEVEQEAPVGGSKVKVLFKQIIYDNRLEDIPAFVASKINEMEAEREEEAKN